MLFTSLLAVACTSPPSAPEAEDKQQSPVVLENIVLTETDRRGGGPVWELKARRAEYTRDGNRATLQQVQGIFFQNGKRVLNVRAPHGEVRINEREIRLLGGVKAVSSARQTSLSLKEMQWFPDRNRLIGIGPVLIQQPQEQLRVRGQDLLGNLALQTYTLSGQVIAESATQRARLTAPRVTWTLPTNRIEARGGVTVQSQDRGITLTAASATWEIAQRRILARAGTSPVVARHTPSASELEAATITWNVAQRTLSCVGSVRATLNSGRSHLDASEAVYDLANALVTATAAHYRQTSSKLDIESPRIVADLRRDSVRASGGGVTTRFEPAAIR